MFAVKAEETVLVLKRNATKIAYICGFRALSQDNFFISVIMVNITSHLRELVYACTYAFLCFYIQKHVYGFIHL